MKKRNYSEEQIFGFIKQVEAGMPVDELCKKHGFPDVSFYMRLMRVLSFQVIELMCVACFSYYAARFTFRTTRIPGFDVLPRGDATLNPRFRWTVLFPSKAGLRPHFRLGGQ